MRGGWQGLRAGIVPDYYRSAGTPGKRYGAVDGVARNAVGNAGAAGELLVDDDHAHPRRRDDVAVDGDRRGTVGLPVGLDPVQLVHPGPVGSQVARELAAGE